MRKNIPDSRIFGGRAFRVRWDARKEQYIALDDSGTLLGVDRKIEIAIKSAVSQAKIASQQGSQVRVLVEQSNGLFRRAYFTPDFLI